MIDKKIIFPYFKNANALKLSPVKVDSRSEGAEGEGFEPSVGGLTPTADYKSDPLQPYSGNPPH
jgi:hypothetical protein